MFVPTTGRLAAALLAIYPPAIFFDGLIQKTSLEIWLTCGVLWTIGRLLDRPTAMRALAVGAVLGALCLSRENALVLLPLLAGWVAWWGPRPRGQGGGSQVRCSPARRWSSRPWSCGISPSAASGS